MTANSEPSIFAENVAALLLPMRQSAKVSPKILITQTARPTPWKGYLSTCISNTHSVTFHTSYSCLECLPHHVLPYMIRQNFQYSLFQMSVHGIEILTKMHRKTFEVIHSRFLLNLFDQPLCGWLEAIGMKYCFSREPQISHGKVSFMT